MKLSNIQVVVWDFDGTFYKSNPELHEAIREAEYTVIIKHTGWTREKALEEFQRLYKVVTPSATQVVAKLCGIPTTDAALEMEKFYDRRTYMGRDEKLIALFNTLSGYKHYILANGVIYRLQETLQKLGVPESTFQEIITSEVVGENKPSDKGYKYILKKTGLPANAHLMVGDRQAVDLDPAKKEGFMTCLVWSQDPTSTADATCPTVYDVASLLV